MAILELWTSDRHQIEAINKNFLQGMINRLIVGFYRYEKDTPPSQRNYLKRIKNSFVRYEKTKNKEFLMDAANYCMREFDHPSMPGTFFESTDSDGRRRKD